MIVGIIATLTEDVSNIPRQREDSTALEKVFSQIYGLLGAPPPGRASVVLCPASSRLLPSPVPLPLPPLPSSPFAAS